MATGFGGNSNFGSLFNGANGAPGSNPPKQNKNQIITSLYRSVLGRDPDPNALMYYISQPEINEDVVRKQMLESEEHKKILEEYKGIPSLKKQIEDTKKGDEIEQKKLQDKQAEIDELNKILSHKSAEIHRLTMQLQELQSSNQSKSLPVVPHVQYGEGGGIKKLLRTIFNNQQ